MASEETLKLFNKIYNETYLDILKYVICNCSNIEDVKDIMQNIYLAVLRRINKGYLLDKAYILGIAYHKIKDYYRFNYKAKIISLFTKEDEEKFENIPSEVDIQKEIIQSENINLIWEYLKNEKVIISKIFYLYYYADLSIKEISITLNISESNVKNYLYRTLRKLNKYFKDRGDINV